MQEGWIYAPGCHEETAIQVQAVEKFIETWLDIWAIKTSADSLSSRGAQNAKISLLKDFILKIPEAVNQLQNIKFNMSEETLVGAFEKRLLSEGDKHKLQLIKILGKLIKFQRIQTEGSGANGGNGVSSLQNQNSVEIFYCPSHPPIFEIQPGPLIEKISSNIGLYLSYGVGDDVIYILIEERKGPNQQPTQSVELFALGDGNTIERKASKKWAESGVLGRISISHGGLLFGTCCDDTGKVYLKLLDESEENVIKTDGQWFVEGPMEFRRVGSFIHFGTPERLLITECIGNNQVQLTGFENARKYCQKSFEVPHNMRTMLVFYRNDYIFLANEESNDLVVVKISERGKPVEPFQICNLKMSHMTGVHGIIAIDRGEKIYLVAIQLLNLQRLMIYEVRFPPVSNDPTNFKPEIELAQAHDLNVQVMALIRTLRNDKIVFITIDEQIGVLQLKDI